MFALKLLRVVLGIVQAELARRAEVSVRELARIERAEVLPRARVAQAIDGAIVAILFERTRSATKENA